MASEENREQPTAANQDTTLSLSNTERIALLQNTIERLGKVVEDLSANPEMDLPLDDSINTLVSTTEKIASAIAPPVSPEAPESPADRTTPVSPEAEVPESSADRTPPATTPQTPPKTVAEASKTKEQTKPVGQKKGKNKSALIAAIALTAIALVAVVIFWLPQREISLPETTETTETIVSKDEVTPEETSDNLIAETPTETIEIPAVEPEATDLEAETLESETTVEVGIPPELTAPGKEKNLKVKTIQPQINLTPEQSLIATIQTKASEIIQEYAPEDDLIVNVEANFVNNHLLVQVKDLWYQLDNSRQAEIANELLERSRQLNFYKLAIKDSNNNLVARSPVVGDEAIILENIDGEAKAEH